MKTKLIIGIVFIIVYFMITSFFALIGTDGILLQKGFFSEYHGSHVICFGVSVHMVEQNRCFGTLGFIGE